MTSKIKKALIGGTVGTAVMTAIMMIAPFMGLPKMNPAEMLSIMIGFPIIVGWLLHFMIGITFALVYAFVFINIVKKVSNNFLKGAIFGMAVFIFAQIMMGIMGMILPMPAMEGNMALMMLGSIMGHIIFGIVVALFVKE